MPAAEESGRGLEAEELGRLYDAWGGRVYRYIVHLIGSGPVTEDLFQETWLKVVECRGQLRDAERFGPWVLRIARNQVMNHARGRKRRGQVWILSNLACSEDEDGGAGLLEQADGGPGPREEAIAAERRRILAETIGELDGQTQEMLQLRYFEGLTLAEVAEVTGGAAGDGLHEGPSGAGPREGAAGRPWAARDSIRLGGRPRAGGRASEETREGTREGNTDDDDGP